MKPLITIAILLAAASMTARPSESTVSAVAPSTPLTAAVAHERTAPDLHDADAQPGVVWLTDYAVARSIAVGSNKRLLVRFTAPWCVPCARHASLDKEREVILRKFVLLKVNVDQQPGWRLRGVPILKAKGIPYESVYEPSDMRPLWAGNPLRVRNYLDRLRDFSMRSVLRRAVRQVSNGDKMGTTGHPGNPLCRCNPCLCGDNCRCGQVAVPVRACETGPDLSRSSRHSRRRMPQYIRRTQLTITHNN